MSTTPRGMRFDKTDFAAVRLFIVLIAIATTVSTVVFPLLSWFGGQPLTVRLEPGEGGDRVGELSDRVTQLDAGVVVARFENATVAERLADFLPGVFAAVAVLTVLWILWRFIGNVRAARPFVAENQASLRQIAMVLLLAPFGYLVFDGFAHAFLMSSALESERGTLFSTRFDPAIVLMIAVLGFVLAMMAEVLKRGMNLQRDTEGLV